MPVPRDGDYSGRVDIRIAAYGVIIESGRILLAHWNEAGHTGWTLPGGGLEPGEDPADADRVRDRRRFRLRFPLACGRTKS